MAIRTKTPLVICSTIRDFGASTKWSAISTSRLTGLGASRSLYLHTVITFLSQAMKTVVVFFREEWFVIMTFVLHTQEHHHIYFFNDFIDSDETSIVFKFRTSPFVWTCKVEGCSPNVSRFACLILPHVNDPSPQRYKLSSHQSDRILGRWSSNQAKALAWCWPEPSPPLTIEAVIVGLSTNLCSSPLQGDGWHRHPPKSWHGQDGIVKVFPFVHRACLYIKVKEITSQFQLCHFKGFVGNELKVQRKGLRWCVDLRRLL